MNLFWWPTNKQIKDKQGSTVHYLFCRYRVSHTYPLSSWSLVLTTHMGLDSVDVIIPVQQEIKLTQNSLLHVQKLRCWTDLSLVFICRENPRRSVSLLFPDHPRFCPLMKTQNHKYPRWSGMVGDKSGESGAFLFSRRIPDFCDGWRSIKIYENSIS